MFELDALKKYNNINKDCLEEKILFSNPYELIKIIFENLHISLKKSIFWIENKNIPMKGREISKSISIIESGLIPALNSKINSSIVDDLKFIYMYSIKTLLEANIENNVEKLKHVNCIIKNISSAWKKIKK
ncbi:fliS [Wigglesworthia glossinidia endosymbiont of Glossina brevipalpis]|uniref:Flagellar secretion chaperone FliS n=1 Tax=Wigglesworthia glossinidia brevipalpis TaxID=36870 RepID=Q8D3D9_WIGBR|nr:fliS [Wigglesworthia glossinidia endosymbiont of Glossina brevipalpis]